MDLTEFPVLYPFGFDSGDTSHQKLEYEDNECVNVALTTAVVFYDVTYNDIYVTKLFTDYLN